MDMQQETRGASRRVHVGRSAQSPDRGGRSAPPAVRAWAPLIAKLALAVGAALLLAFIGTRAGANPPSSSPPLPPAADLAVASAAVDGGASPAAAQPPGGDGPPPEGQVVLNTAGEDELQKLPGIGPARARAILALRARLVRFRSPRDLLRVKGIGPKTLQRMLPMLVLDPPRRSADAGAAGDDPHVQPSRATNGRSILPAPS